MASRGGGGGERTRGAAAKWRKAEAGGKVMGKLGERIGGEGKEWEREERRRRSNLSREKLYWKGLRAIKLQIKVAGEKRL